MFAIERLNQIKQILYEQKHIDVTTLSELLSVSEVTIRRDLDKLEKEGFLTKSYGGAVLNQENMADDIDIEDIEDKYLKDKKFIASIACQIINNDEAVFLGAGSTCMQIAKNLKNMKRLTVVTNDIAIVSELMTHTGIKVIISGGEVFSPATTVGGQMAEQFIKSLFINKAFISIQGVDMERGFTTYDMNEALLYKAVISISKETIIVADHSKFNKVTFSQIAQLNEVDKVISDKDVDDKYKKYFFENNIKIYTTYQIS
ncbi:MAG TPA: DeoR/GlpR transcriptional regulator [Firmicutes bacterium]|jgi:DeoR family transcriptional regulator, fructose operon transcriptional repressor|nr:DeoR/GlpR transcriptional regulator [Bacillota bacterium]